MRKTFTDLIPKKQAPAICLSLTGGGREAALQLSIETLNSEGPKYKDQLIYGAYDNFEKFMRHMNMSDHLNEFERLNINLK